jgi:hypothetical protein
MLSSPPMVTMGAGKPEPLSPWMTSAASPPLMLSSPSGRIWAS